MSEVIITEVTTKSQLRKFMDFPNKMYKNVPQFIPSFYGDDLADWDKNKNPAFEYCEAKAFLAYRDGQIVGRIGAILSHRANEKWNTNRMRFSQLDFIDDKEVSAKLFEAVEAWAREKGCDEVHGPLGFTDMDSEGLLVDGYEEQGLFFTYYCYPYYKEHLEALGYAKDVDWVEMKLPVPSVDDKYYQLIHRLSERALRSGKFHKVILTNHKQFKPYIKKVFDLVNISYSHLYGTVDLGQEQIDKYASKFVPLINPDYCALVCDEEDNLVAFGVCAPSVDKAIKRSNGRLFPFGWIGVLKSLKKSSVVDLLLMAVHPDYRNTGLNSVVIDHIMTSCIKNGVEYAETGPQLEKNVQIISQWKMIQLEEFKRRRCFIKKI